MFLNPFSLEALNKIRRGKSRCVFAGAVFLSSNTPPSRFHFPSPFPSYILCVSIFAKSSITMNAAATNLVISLGAMQGVSLSVPRTSDANLRTRAYAQMEFILLYHSCQTDPIRQPPSPHICSHSIRHDPAACARRVLLYRAEGAFLLISVPLPWARSLV